MPVATTKDRKRNLTLHVVSGRVSREEMFAALERAYEDQPTPFVLWDMSHAELSHVVPDGVHQLVKQSAEFGVKRRGGRTAVVAPSDLQYGLARMSEAFAELTGLPFKYRVFRSRKAALRWLKYDES